MSETKSIRGTSALSVWNKDKKGQVVVDKGQGDDTLTYVQQTPHSGRHFLPTHPYYGGKGENWSSRIKKKWKTSLNSVFKSNNNNNTTTSLTSSSSNSKKKI